MTKSKRFLDPMQLLTEIAQSGFDMSKFKELDESQFAKAPNFLDFIIGRDFCDATLLPWQVEAGMHLFSDYCPVCSNPDYLTDLFDETIGEIRDNITMLQHGVCPKCKLNRLDLFSQGVIGPKPSLKNEIIAALGQRSGKCLASGTEVLTPGGPQAIETLRPGDTIYAYDPQTQATIPSRVKAVQPQGEQDVVEMVQYNRVLGACTPNHRWLTINDVNKTLASEKTLEFREFRKSTSVRREFVKVPCGPIQEPHAYAIGAFLGDGCSRQGTGNTIDVSAEQVEVPRKIAAVLGAKTYTRNHSGNYTWHIRAGDTHSREILTCHHYAEWCKGRYAHEKIVDLEIVKTWDRESCLEFLSGLMDSDGSIRVKKNNKGEPTSLTLGYTSQSLSLIEAVEYLCLRLFQFKPYRYLDDRDKYKNGPCWVLKYANTFFILRALKELKVVNPARFPSLDSLRIRNSNPKFTKISAGKTYRAQTWDIEIEHPSHLYLLAHLGLITHNSKLVVAAATYMIHRWLKLPDPLAYYDLPRMEIVIGTFSALSDDQANENLWIPFRGLYDNAPWFKQYNEFLTLEGKRMGVPLFEVRETYLYYLHKRLLISYTGADDRKKRGRTRLFGAIDEIAFFNSEQGPVKKKVLDADKNYTALSNSLSTIRQKALRRMQQHRDHDVLLPVMFNASSPLNALDKIMRLLRGAPDNLWAYAVHRATWHANADYSEANCRAMSGNISEVEFQRDFGAVPPYSDSPFIQETRFLEKLCGTHPPILVAERHVHNDSMQDRYVFLKARPVRVDKMIPRLLALDNGFNQNAFAATVFRYDPLLKKPVLDFACSLYPDKSAGLSIHFPSMFEQFIIPIIQAFNIKHVFYDRWQSLDQIQRLRDMKVNAQAHSLSFEKDLLPFKQQLLSGNMVLPPMEMDLQAVKDATNPLQEVQGKPIVNLIWQAMTVRQVGRKLLKPVEGDDDIFRAFCLGGSRFLDAEILKQYQVFGGVQRALLGDSVGAYHSFKGGAVVAATGAASIHGTYRSSSGRRR